MVCNGRRENVCPDRAPARPYSTPSEPALPIAPPRYALAAYGARRVRAQDDAIEQQATDACAGASEDSNASRAPSAADMAWVRAATSVLPFVLDAFVQMDNCAGTNKSQFVFGGFALLLTLGLLDVVRPRFMIAGHTKFGPDVVAQKIAGQYNKADVFNHAQLNERAALHASVKAYDGTAMLRTYRACTPSLFRAVTHINSYRLFTLVRDDGLFDIGDGLNKSGTDAKDFPGSGMVFPEATIEAALNALKRRSAIRVLRSVRACTFAGVGAGSGLFGARREQLVPDCIERAYAVRFFVKVEEKGTYWMDIPNYTKVCASELTASVIAALSEIVPYAVSTHDKQQGTEVVGPRAAQIIEQYKKLVPAAIRARRVRPRPGRRQRPRRCICSDTAALGAGAADRASRHRHRRRCATARSHARLSTAARAAAARDRAVARARASAAARAGIRAAVRSCGWITLAARARPACSLAPCAVGHIGRRRAGEVEANLGAGGHHRYVVPFKEGALWPDGMAFDW